MTSQFGFPLNEINREANRLINNLISSWISYHSALPFCSILFSYILCSLVPHHPKHTLLISSALRCSDMWKWINLIDSSSGRWWLKVSWCPLKLGDTSAKWVVTLSLPLCLSIYLLVSRDEETINIKANHHWWRRINNCNLLYAVQYKLFSSLSLLALHVQYWDQFYFTWFPLVDVSTFLSVAFFLAPTALPLGCDSSLFNCRSLSRAGVRKI